MKDYQVLLNVQKKLVQFYDKQPECYLGGVLLPNGDVVFIPWTSPTILVYSPDYAKPIYFPKEACESPYLNKL